jgi:hypothetical protein
MAKERAIAMKIIYCRRCAQENFIGDDGLCEDCRELIALRGKVLMKQSRIDGQDAEIKRLREALEYIADTITPSIGSSTVSRSIIKESDFEKLKLESTSGICMKYQIQNCGVCDNIYCSDNTSAAKDAIRTLESTLRSEQTKREELQRQKADALEMLKRLLMHESDCELAALIREMEGE